MPLPTHPVLEAFLAKHSSTKSQGQRIAIFDCDDTIIKGDIGESMFYFQLEHFLFRTSPALLWPDFPKLKELGNLYDGLSSLPPEKRTVDRRFLSFAEMMLSWYFLQLAAQQTEKACGDIVRLFTGYTQSEVRQIAQAVLKHELGSSISERKLGRHTLPLGIRYIRETMDLLERLQHLGFETWFVSGSNQWSVEAVFAKLGIPSTRVIGIDLIDGIDGLTQEVRKPIPVKEGKVLALKERIMQQPIIVVSDSIYDIPLYRYSAELNVLINQHKDGSDRFFVDGGVARDASWIVIEQPTLDQ